MNPDAGQIAALTLLALLTIAIAAATVLPALYDRACDAIDRHVELALNGIRDVEEPALTDCPVFDATIRAMPLTKSTLAVQGLLLDGEAIGDECEEWLRSGGASC